MMVWTSGDEEGRGRGGVMVDVDESEAVGEHGSAAANMGWGGKVVTA
jgi:hypothetical protein